MDLITNGKTTTEIKNLIFSLRRSGKLDEAIALTEKTSEENPQSYFYPKIKGDLLFQNDKYDAAADAWVSFLKKMPPAPKVFRDFARRYYKLKKVFDQKKIEDFASHLLNEINLKHIKEPVAKRCLVLIKEDLTEISDNSDMAPLIESLQDDKSFHKCVTTIKELDESNPIKLEIIIDKHVLNRPRNIKTFKIDAYCVSFYEKLEKHDNAIKIAEELLSVKLDAIVLRSLFRNCRQQGDFDKIETILTKYPEILKSNNFNLLYELVYYFEARDRFDDVKLVLLRIEKSGIESSPILKTVKNFYLRFGLTEEAKRVSANIAKKEDSRFADEVSETEEVLASTVELLHSQLEHQKQLAAISDLTTGISHELGQPITNIRFTIQLHQRLLKEPISKEHVNKVFNSILEETKRMGGLIRRLSPLTSSKSHAETFDLIERIKIRVKAEDARFSRMRKPKINIIPHDKPIFLFGDPVKFDQLITNLLLNAIDGIKEKNPRQTIIKIIVCETKTDIHIKFSDNGIGIPFKYRVKIFDPFFSTKAPGKGEGLGLFIIWNIIKYMGGTISLDSNYTRGAQFLLKIPKLQDADKEV